MALSSVSKKPAPPAPKASTPPPPPPPPPRREEKAAPRDGTPAPVKLKAAAPKELTSPLVNPKTAAPKEGTPPSVKPEAAAPKELTTPLANSKATPPKEGTPPSAPPAPTTADTADKSTVKEGAALSLKATSPSEDRAALLKQTNADLKIMDKELLKTTSRAKEKLGVYENANTELKNQLTSAQSGDPKTWKGAAEALTKTFDETQNGRLLNSDELGADAERMETEHLDPILRRIKDAGYDMTEFMKSDDVYKMTTDTTPMRELAAATQTLAGTASELKTSLSKSFSDPANGISKDEDAIKTAERMTAVFGEKSSISTGVEKTYAAAKRLAGTANAPRGTSADPKWTTVNRNQQQFFDDMNNVYTPAAETPFIDPAVKAVKQEILTQVGRKIGAINSLNEKTGDLRTALISQDFPHVQAEDNLSSFSSKAFDFLKELQSDNEELGKYNKEYSDLIDQYEMEGEVLNVRMNQEGWDLEKLQSEAPSETGQLDVAAGTLEKNTTQVLDAAALYNQRVEAKAEEFLAAWDSTKKNQSTKETLAAINGVLDIASGLGIGGNAITQLTTNQLAKGWEKMADVTNAVTLRGGQIIDMVQAGMNGGISLDSLKNGKDFPGAIEEINRGGEKAGSAVSRLYFRLRDFADEEKARNTRHEGKTGW
jgi:hypothetical protein